MVCLCLLPSTHPYGYVCTAQELSSGDREVTEGALRAVPSGPPWPPEWHCKASLRNLHLLYLCCAPCHSSCFVVISGFEAQLAPELSLQKVLGLFLVLFLGFFGVFLVLVLVFWVFCFCVCVISRQSNCFPGGEEAFLRLYPAVAGCRGLRLPASLHSSRVAEMWDGIFLH